MSKFTTRSIGAAIAATMLGGAIALLPAVTASADAPAQVVAVASSPNPNDRGAALPAEVAPGQDLSGVIVALGLMCAGAGVLAWRRSATTM